MRTRDYPRDLAVFDGHLRDSRWPRGARIAVQFVPNSTEGVETCFRRNDLDSEAVLSEIVVAPPTEIASGLPIELCGSRPLGQYAGRPGRFRALKTFTNYVTSHDDLSQARRVSIARHWREVHPLWEAVRD